MTFQTIGTRMAVLAFMALVTGAVLALLILELARGFASVAQIAVYAVTASFGLDFLVAAWRSLWADPQRTG